MTVFRLIKILCLKNYQVNLECSIIHQIFKVELINFQLEKLKEVSKMEDGARQTSARLLYSNMILSLSRGETADEGANVAKLSIHMDKFGIDKSNQALLLQNLPFLNFIRHKFLENVDIFDFFSTTFFDKRRLFFQL